ncbi:uncharacterized protein LOC113914950 isoform X1 [Zalophus californianus]|uniref:Uncharacterized protein LOC113914950 isoform X1 n=2 Tax=Zalophus californianus TaxID=9704 RepID=A0A6J2BWZ0_ZALCA|nr:uncharacterized protein LOC113914950 isoform X1 [Zalophus californianus]
MCHILCLKSIVKRKGAIHSLQFLYHTLIKMPQSYTLKLETRALGAVQIMNGLIYSALGFLCFALFLEEEERKHTGYIPVVVTLTYIFWSLPFFISSGSTIIGAQKRPTKYKLIYSLVMNILSVCFSIVGTIILSIACFTYHADTNEYVWTHMAGSMLLQYLLFSTITEVICACITIRWIVVALSHPEYSEKSPSLSESSVSIKGPA